MFWIIIIILLSVVAIIAAASMSSKSNTSTTEQPQQSDEELMEHAQYLIALIEVRRQAEQYGDTVTMKAIDDMKYDGPIPQLLEDGSYTRIYALHDYNIAGINYRENIGEYVGDFDGYLQADPDNEHDHNAIAVYHSDGHHLGFIPAGCTDYIRAFGFPFPIQITGTIEQEHDDIDDRDYFVGTVYLYALKSK
jgi:hypothetical protein